MNNYWKLASFLLLASCTVGPDYKQPQFFTEKELQNSLQLDTQNAQKVRRDWYVTFNDEVLNSLIERSLQENPNVNATKEKLKQARQSLKINNVKYFPTIDLDGSYHGNQVSKNIGPAIDTDYYQTGLDATWELDIWGAGRRLSEGSEALFKAAGANFFNVRLSLTAEVANNYISLRTAQEQLRLAERNLRLQKNIYEMVSDKYKAGLENDIALNQAKYAVETTQTLIPDLKYEVEAYKNALAILCGKLPGSLEGELQDTTQNIVRKKFKYDLVRLYQLPTSVVRNRPDVQAAEEMLIAKNAAVGQAIAQLYPNVSLSGFLGYQANNSSQLIGGRSSAYSYSPVVNLPVLHWGALINNVELQKGVAKEYLYTYQESLLAASNDIKNSYANLTQEYHKNEASRQAVKAQKQVMDLSLERYRSGLMEFSDLLTAEQDLLKSQVSLISSNGTIYQNIVAFYKAVGGGYDYNLAQTAVTCDNQKVGCENGLYSVGLRAL